MDDVTVLDLVAGIVIVVFALVNVCLAVPAGLAAAWVLGVAAGVVVALYVRWFD